MGGRTQTFRFIVFTNSHHFGMCMSDQEKGVQWFAYAFTSQLGLKSYMQCVADEVRKEYHPLILNNCNWKQEICLPLF